ncbi:MAG TPA: hypothetical protein VFT42_04005 [Solirubrobacteraceae bacterium]|nr:hypothetical protein [Solirubrobacteraceae bacterium]
MASKGARLAALTAAVWALSATAAQAQQRPTIGAAPNPTTAGDPVVIFGTAPPGSRVVLWHRVNPAPRFTPVQRTTADSAGRYEFSRADGVVTSNRNWFVRVDGRRSRTVHERVFALVTLQGPASTNVDTGVPTTFTGTVTPPHAGHVVLLQRQSAASGGDDWHTITRGRIGAGGAYTIVHRFRVPGDANVRVVLPRTRRNLRSPSNVLSLQIEQRENPALTLTASANPLDEGQSVTLSGTVAGVSSPQPVTLMARTAGRRFAPAAQGMTDASGGYSFTQTPVASTFYRVVAKPKRSAVLFEGVRDVVTASVNATRVVAGSTLTFTGAVSPDKTGHVIYLQMHNARGDDWHDVAQARVLSGSTFTLTRRVAVPGTKVFRVLIPGGPENQRGASAPITVTVTPNSAPI